MPGGGKKCSFISCSSTQCAGSSLRFFRFPVRDASLCEKWVINCANEGILDLPSKTLASRVVCELHFSADAFSGNTVRTKLLRNAVPTKLVVGDNVKSKKEPCSSQQARRSIPPQEAASSIEDEAVTLNPSKSIGAATSKWLVSPTKTKRKSLISTPDTPRKISLKKRITKQKQSLHRIRQNARRNHLKKLTKEEAVFAVSQYIKSESFKTLLNMQVLYKTGTPWKDPERQLATELHYRSPPLYKNMREVKKIVLPDTSTISKWANVLQLQPGISEELLERLKLKINTMDDTEKQAVLVFDEMTIMKFLSYNEKSDVVEGFEDLGSLGRSSRIGTHIMLFLVRGLFHTWKMPVAYYVSGSVVDGSNLLVLVREVLTALLDIGLNVRALVCDQGTNNIKTITMLPATPEKPTFTINDKEMFFMYDPPHLVKSVRNNLMKHDIEFEGGTASWKHIRMLYELDSSSTVARSLCKLTRKHIHPNSFDKMKVKLATQVFSQSVKAAMLTAVQTGELPEEANETAQFIGEMNDLFDCLNSRRLFDPNPLRCGISDKTRQGKQVIHHLEMSLDWLDTWKKVIPLKIEGDTLNLSTGKKTKKSGCERPPCFDGLKLTVKSVLMFWETLSKEGTSFLLTNRLTQDAVENEFSIFRRQGGFNRNPSAMKFRQNLRHRMIVSLMTPPSTSNCEDDDAELVIHSGSQSTAQVDSDKEEDAADITLNEVDERADEVDFEFENEDEELYSHPPETSLQPHTLENCSVRYVAGYMAKVAKDKLSCAICNKEFISDKFLMLSNPNELLMLNKCYATEDETSHLTAPSEEFTAVVSIALNCFSDHFDKVKHLFNLKSIIVDRVKNVLSKRLKNWLKTGLPCEPHRQFILNKLILLKLRKTLLWFSRDLKASKSGFDSAYRQKLKNVQNQ